MEISTGRQSVVLGALLLNANRVVGSDQLIDLVWPEDPPATARTQIQICVSALRKTLVRAGHEKVLVTRRPGYVLEVADHDVDHLLFRACVAESGRLAQGGRAPAEAAAALRSALALWRGRALEGVESDGLLSRARYLEEARSTAFDTLIDMQLELGEHEAVVSEVRRVIEQAPLRERPYAQLMTALSRTGRRADALVVYQDARRRLVDELGIEPGSELRAVQDAILEGPSPVWSSGGEQQDVEGRVPGGTPTLRPFQLPADAGDFGGRSELVTTMAAALTGQGRSAVPVVVLVGKPGVGKTALAVHVAHRLAGEFPDGQLYCELTSGCSRPSQVGEILGRFVRALGVPGAGIPDGDVDRGELFRTLAAGRRMLVVLDDATSEQQVRALLPGTARCAVIVTSRTMLTGIAGAVIHELDALDPTRSRELLARVVGEDRVNAESSAADALIRMVGGLPLALRIVAARLAARPQWPLTVMLERLADERRRLDELTHGEMIMRASLAMSYDGLAPEARRALSLLSLVSMDSYPVWAAAALIDRDETSTAALLEMLVDVHLLEMATLDLDGLPRYRFHVIIRLFAHERLQESETEDARRAALLRLGGAWLAMTDEVHRRAYGGDYMVMRSSVARFPADPRRVDRLLVDPLAWLDAERGNARSFITEAADFGAVEVCWDLAVNMVDLFESGLYFDEWAATHETALAAAVGAGDLRGEAAVRVSIGTLHLVRGRAEAAEDTLRRALAIFQDLDDTAGIALAGRELAWVDRMNGDDVAAACGYRAALEAFEKIGDPIGRAHVLGRLAEIDLEAGAADDADTRLQEALALCRTAGNSRVEIQILFRLGIVAAHQGRLDEADAGLTDLLERVRRRRDVIGEARILHELGIVRLRRGESDEAVRLLRQAVVVRERSMDHADIERLQADLVRAEAARAAAGCPMPRSPGTPAPNRVRPPR